MSEICLSVFCTQHSFSRTRGKMVVQAGRRDSNDWRSFSNEFLVQTASAGRRRRQGWPGCSTVGSDGSSAGFFLLRGVRLPFLPGGGGGGFIGRPVGGGGAECRAETCCRLHKTFEFQMGASSTGPTPTHGTAPPTTVARQGTPAPAALGQVLHPFSRAVTPSHKYPHITLVGPPPQVPQV